MKWGGLTVVGAGVGAWAGVGFGGSISAKPLKLSISAMTDSMAFPVVTPATKKLVTNLDEILGPIFKDWADSVAFRGVPYMGTTMATPISPGTFDAQNLPPMTFLSASSGKLPSGISQKWNDKLKQEEGGVKFLLDDPDVKTKEMTDAIGAALEMAFTTVWMLSRISGNSVSGSAAPGGIGSGSSKMDGKVL